MRRWLSVLVILLGAPAARAQPTIEVRHVRVGYGGSGVGVLNAPAPGWVIGTVELRTRGDVRGLRLHSIEVLDATGSRVALAQGELELRVAPSDRTHGDFSRYGTSAAPTTIESGRRVLLWMHARIDGDFEEVIRTHPARYRARLRTADGARLIVEGALEGPWPTG